MENKDHPIQAMKKRGHTGPRRRRRRNKTALEDTKDNSSLASTHSNADLGAKSDSAWEKSSQKSRSRATSMSSLQLEELWNETYAEMTYDYVDAVGPSTGPPIPQISPMGGYMVDQSSASYLMMSHYHSHANPQSSWIYNEQNLVAQQEKEKWSRWAAHAGLQHEMEERKEREKEEMTEHTTLLEEFNERSEREVNRQWAMRAVERERKEQEFESYVNNVTKTTWFGNLITEGIADYKASSSSSSSSSLSMDYEIVCPLYGSGCRLSFPRKQLAEHLAVCQFSPYNSDKQNSEGAFGPKIAEDYTVVCPNTMRGCDYTGSVRTIQQHLEVCPMRGSSREEEAQQREETRRRIMLEYEQERSRRMKEALENQDDPSNEDTHLAYTWHRHFRAQVTAALHSLHDTIAREWELHKQAERDTHIAHKHITDGLSAKIHEIWPFAALEVIGSAALGMSVTASGKGGLQGGSSDLDIVICFSDQAQGLLGLQGTLIRVLAEHLQYAADTSSEKDKNGFATLSFRILKVLSQARVPLLKAAVTVDGKEYCLDISIDGARNTGLTSTAMIGILLHHMQPLGPVVHTLKRHLKPKGLSDAYTGGLGSYSLLVLVFISMLRQVGKERSAATAATSSLAVAAAGATEERLASGGDTADAAAYPEKVVHTNTNHQKQQQQLRSGGDILPLSTAATENTVDTTTIAPSTPRRASVSRHPTSWIKKGAHLTPSRPASASASMSRSRANSLNSLDGGGTPKSGARGQRRVRREPSSWIKHGSQAAGATTGHKHSVADRQTSPLRPAMIPGGGVLTTTHHTWTNISLKKEHGIRIALSLLRGEKLPVALHPSYPAAVGIYSQQHHQNHQQHQQQHEVPGTPPRPVPVPSSPRRPGLAGAEKGLWVAGDDYSLNQPDQETLLGLPPLLESAAPVYGVMLENFLRFFGEGNIPSAHGYSAREGGFRFHLSSSAEESAATATGGATDRESNSSSRARCNSEVDTNPHAGAVLVIEDPVSPQLNITNNVYKLAEVQKELCDALENFRRMCVRHDTGSGNNTMGADHGGGGGGGGGKQSSPQHHHKPSPQQSPGNMDIFSK